MKKIIDCLRNDEFGYKIENNLGFNAFDRIMRIAAKKEMAHKGLDKVFENLYFELYRLDGDDILDEERFYFIDDVDFDGIVTNPDGSQSLPMNLCSGTIAYVQGSAIVKTPLSFRSLCASSRVGSVAGIGRKLLKPPF